jgi:hypothetical protein
MICMVRMDEWKDDGKCSGVTVTVYGTVMMNPCGETKGACRHVSIPTLKSVGGRRKLRRHSISKFLREIRPNKRGVEAL